MISHKLNSQLKVNNLYWPIFFLFGDRENNMAESVEKNIEASASEVIYIKKLKLVSKAEINEIIRKRNQHEYSLQKRSKRLLDYEAYIGTELSLLKLLKFRRQKMDDRRFKDKIEKSIITRLVRLHRQTCFRFQSRIDVWIRFIQFCKAIGRHLSVVRIWGNLLKIHGRTDPRLWAAAASYHLHENTNAKIRSTLRSLSLESKQLSTEHRKLQQKLVALKRHVGSKEQAKVQTVVGDLRRHSQLVEQAAAFAAQERSLTWDRLYLTSIREARRLLTEGITLNPENNLLYLELVKLEIAAIDFFVRRIQPRTLVSVNNVSENQVNTDAPNRDKSLLTRMKDENTAFMKSVTEDVHIITSGKALYLVVENLTERWSLNQELLQSLSTIISEAPLDLVEDRLRTLLTLKIKEANQRPKRNVPSQLPIRSCSHVVKRLSQLHACLLQNDQSRSGKDAGCQLLAALALWDSWYPVTVKTSGSQGDNFRCLNPHLPGACGLLRARILLHQLVMTWKPVLDDSLQEMPVSSWYHLSQSEVTVRMRSWLDQLATSRWGEESPEFWIAYLDFERHSGDCTRLPAVQWRAHRVLKPEPLKKFINLTVSLSPYS